MVDPKAFGRQGEAEAALFLKEQGCAILERNYRTPVGEVDLVVQDGDEVVFVEVKKRRSSCFGGPEGALTQGKREKIIRVAKWYMMEKGLEGVGIRFDVIAISNSGGKRRLSHYKGAFGDGFY